MINIYQKFIRVGQALIEIFLPNKCFICGEFDPAPVCPLCVAKVVLQPVTVARTLPHITQIVALAPYQEPIREMLQLLKFSSHQGIGRLLAEQITQALPVLPYATGALWLPVPIHHRKLKQRGFNQVDILFQGLRPYVNYQPALIRQKNTKPLFDLKPEERRQALKDAFCLGDDLDLQDQPIVLLDDIVTTGCTVTEIARILKEKGAGEIYVLSLCYAV